MTRRRRTANPIFQQPLTTPKLTEPELRYLRCHRCGSTGTAHRGLRKGEDGRYECNDVVKCKKLATIWASRKEAK